MGHGAEGGNGAAHFAILVLSALVGFSFFVDPLSGNSFYAVDAPAHFFKVIALITTIVVLVMSLEYKSVIEKFVPGLTPGDFVRSMKQLIDLLDQIAVASRSQASSTTEAGPSERPPSDRQAGDTHAGETEAGDTHSGDTHSGDTHSGDTEAGDTGPAGERPSREPAPKSRDVASTARAAIDAMRRGVVAYSAVAD